MLFKAFIEKFKIIYLFLVAYNDNYFMKDN